MGVTNTPNMNLPLPNVSQEPGPTWATDINQSLTQVDSHNHAPGQGVPVSAQGINIQTDLTLNTNNAIATRTVRYTPLGSPASSGTDINCTYVSGSDLYYNDTVGNQVQITQNGRVIPSSSGQIVGLVNPASASYIPTSGAFLFQSSANTLAQLNFGGGIATYIATSAIYSQAVVPGATSAGIVFTGARQIDIPASYSTVGSQKIMTNAGTSAATTIFGVVNSNGTTFTGQGFTPSQIGTGVYGLSWSIPFSGLPTVIATGQSLIAVVPSSLLSTTGAVVKTFTNTTPTTGSDTFSFMAIGFRPQT